ncbi:hypothetical protein BESB_058620 [Besnoitia besnoiti]|uniref:Uncharacterized protein n=1 Tax=Besnoitia besnoiti TaxID=94643 RepID=A0A2A9MAG2_BESBE|nr:hypothetical protein BESB_058620 [Besnoitia besnoiti]PFH34975.1 hypothetical protein BESB_058620 [Besnoitia besnoiti]
MAFRTPPPLARGGFKGRCEATRPFSLSDSFSIAEAKQRSRMRPSSSRALSSASSLFCLLFSPPEKASGSPRSFPFSRSHSGALVPSPPSSSSSASSRLSSSCAVAARTSPCSTSSTSASSSSSPAGRPRLAAGLVCLPGLAAASVSAGSPRLWPSALLYVFCVPFVPCSASLPPLRGFASRASRRQRERLEENYLRESLREVVDGVRSAEAEAPPTRASRGHRASSASSAPASAPALASRHAREGEEEALQSSFWGARAAGFSQELSLLRLGTRRARAGESVLDGGGAADEEALACAARDEEGGPGVGSVENEVRRRRRLLRAASLDRAQDGAPRGRRKRVAASGFEKPPSEASPPLSDDAFEALAVEDDELGLASDFVAPAAASRSPEASPLYRSLTHEEAKQMQEAYSEKLHEDRRRRWLRMYGLPNPEREARALLRENEMTRGSREPSGTGSGGRSTRD